MTAHGSSRRRFLGACAAGASAGAFESLSPAFANAQEAATASTRRGTQRLDLARLQAWEALGYGMFIHFGMSTFVGQELPDGKTPPKEYAPERLDVDQWISVARDAGMKYAVLTTKHVAGHCLWPSARSDYTIAQSTDTTDVVGKFVEACGKHGVLPGFYYCSWDNHNRFGSKTPSDPRDGGAPYTTSLYQTFQTAQITELLTQYGPIAEMWIDIPGVLGRGYRTFLYEHVVKLQPDTIIMMNSGISTGETYNVDYAWPSDLIAIERRVPPGQGHRKWRNIEGADYYMPGEVCDPIGKEWFYVEGDVPRPDAELTEQLEACRARGVNFLLDVPPDRAGVIPDTSAQALMRLRKNARL
ncbi:MAG: twin-arginine translocation signal domain-containing protein [Nitrospiraceae bacterium]|nr:twin-arginine translocation signal domain-containing protein [Nitrospiraceae bacterium]